MAAVGARSSSLALITPRAGNVASRTSTLALAAVIAPPPARSARVSDLAMLIVRAANPNLVTRASYLAELMVYSTATPKQNRSLAWTFSMDGHTFYVLDLGNQGTFLYDVVTSQWCKFETQNSVGWNIRNGTMWWTKFAPRVVGGDSTGPQVWEYDPTALFDDGFRDIEHAATAGIMLRSRVFVSMSELRIAASAGELDDTTGAAYIQLTYSDDGGQTYSAPVIVYLDVGTTPNGQQDIRFPSLGAFMAPGRILQISDVGGVLRLDGVDAMLDDYDGGGQPDPESDQ